MASESPSMDESSEQPTNPRKLSQNGQMIAIGAYGFLVLVGFFFGIVTGYDKTKPAPVARKEKEKEPPKPSSDLKPPAPKTNTPANAQPDNTPKGDTNPKEDPKPEPKKDDPKTDVPPEPKTEELKPSKLVELLGSSEAADQEKAEKALRALGKMAEAALREGVKSTDPAVAKKSQELLVAIVGEPKKDDPKTDPKVDIKDIKAVSAKEVMPILLRHCGTCHGQVGKPKDDVDVSTLDKLMKSPSGIGKSIVPGNLEKSGVYQAIVGGSMPPEGKPKPTEKEITLLRNWILTGAKPRRRRLVRDC